MSHDKTSTDDPTPKDLERMGILGDIEKSLADNFDRAKDSETQAINEFEKSLWLANSGAATVTIGYITTAESPTLLQFYGCLSFVGAIMVMLSMRFLSEYIASRDRARRQVASEKFFTENLPMSTLNKIRDNTFNSMANTYKVLKISAGVLFLSGCILTLLGIYPYVSGAEAHNNQFNQGQTAAQFAH